MSQLPLALRRYVIAIWAIALLAWISSWFLSFDHRPVFWPLLGVLLGLLILTQSLPQHALRGTKVSLNTIPMFIAVFSLPVSAAVSMALIGTIVAQVQRRRPWCETGFNSASAILEVYVGGLICAGLALVDGSWSVLAAAFVSAAALYLVNVSIVSGAVATQHNLTYGHVWRAAVAGEAFNHVLMCLAAGLVILPWDWKPFVASVLLLVIGAGVLWTRYQARLTNPL